MIFWRPESDPRREVSADRFLESHFWLTDGLVMTEILFVVGIGKNNHPSSAGGEAPRRGWVICSHGSVSSDGSAGSCMNRFRFPVHG